MDDATYSFVTMEYVDGEDFRARLDKGDRLSDGDFDDSSGPWSGPQHFLRLETSS